jgi:hypothetical protein
MHAENWIATEKLTNFFEEHIFLNFTQKQSVDRRIELVNFQKIRAVLLISFRTHLHNFRLQIAVLELELVNWLGLWCNHKNYTHAQWEIGWTKIQKVILPNFIFRFLVQSLFSWHVLNHNDSSYTLSQKIASISARNVRIFDPRPVFETSLNFTGSSTRKWDLTTKYS